MKIIIDTNLWISFTIGKRLSALESLLKNKRIEIYVCEELLNEYKEVVQRQNSVNILNQMIFLQH